MKSVHRRLTLATTPKRGLLVSPSSRLSATTEFDGVTEERDWLRDFLFDESNCQEQGEMVWAAIAQVSYVDDTP